MTMTIFSKSNSNKVREYKIEYWDQRLYAHLFTTQTDFQKTHGHGFQCVVSRRVTQIQSSGEQDVAYYGWINLPIGPSETCPIEIELKFARPNENFNGSMTETALGYFFFGWRSEKRIHPALHVVIKDVRDLAHKVHVMYAEAKSSGSEGIEFSWRAVLTTMIGLSANEVWGRWPDASPRDEEGVLITGMLPGLHAFELTDFSFESHA